MASPDVVVPALLLPIPLLSLSLALYNYLLHRSTPARAAALLLLAIFAAVAGGTALSVACGQSLRVATKVSTNLLHASLSAVSIYAFGPFSLTHAFPPPFLVFFLSLAAILVACELVSALIPTSPPLLPALFALVARGILLTLAIVTTVLLLRRHAVVSMEIDIEKGCTPSESSGKTPGRVSSPTQATWPFPGSLALQDESTRRACPQNKCTPSNLLPALTFTSTRDVNECTTGMDKQIFIFLPLTLTIAQIFAILSAALSAATNIVPDAMVNRTNRSVQQALLASAVCTLMWSIMVLSAIQLLPAMPYPYTSERQVVTVHEQGLLGGNLGGKDPVMRKPKPSLSRRESETFLDFLSLRDPFASSPLPPPPPPLPPAGLGLDEIGMGWNGNREISMQYRFPAPRSTVKGGRRRGKMTCVNGNKWLVHQDSARTLLPVPETRGPEAEAAGDREFGDEARLAQLLLQSLSEGGEDCDGPNASTSAPTLRSPQPANMQQNSRWSTGTTVQSIMSASISNRSGVSTYTTCASDKVPTSRISMNTIASVLGSRKSSDARRKSAVTASSSKG